MFTMNVGLDELEIHVLDLNSLVERLTGYALIPRDLKAWFRTEVAK